MRKTQISVILTLIAFFFMAGHIRPAFASETLLDLTTSSYSQNLESIAPMAKVLCAKDKQVCIKTIDDTARQEKKDNQSNKKEAAPVYPNATFVSVPIVIQTTSKQPSTETPQDPTQPSPPPSLNSDLIFDRINSYREKFGLAHFEKDDTICSIATERSKEIVGELRSGSLHSGLYNRSLPYWITENAIFARSEEFAISWWMNSPVHHSQIMGNFIHSCIKCDGNACSQVFTSYTPKVTPAQIVITPVASEIAILTN